MSLKLGSRISHHQQLLRQATSGGPKTRHVRTDYFATLGPYYLQEITLTFSPGLDVVPISTAVGRLLFSNN